MKGDPVKLRTVAFLIAFLLTIPALVGHPPVQVIAGGVAVVLLLCCLYSFDREGR